MAKRHQPDQPPDTATDDGRLQPTDHSSRQAIRRRLLQASLGAPLVYTLPHATLAAGSTCIDKPGNVLQAPTIKDENIQTGNSWGILKTDTQPSAVRGEVRGLEHGQGLGLQKDGAKTVQVEGLGKQTIGQGAKVQIDGQNYVYHDEHLYTESCATSLGVTAKNSSFERIR